MAEPLPRLHGIDALRGIAALCVVGLHAHGVFGGYPNWFAKGYLGVDFFLMLSGFMMARVNEPRLAAGLRPLMLMRARYRRMWGTVALGSLIGIPFFWVRSSGLGEFLPIAIANLLLIPWPFLRVVFVLNIPGWTIFYELVANFTHSFVLRHLGTRGLAILVVMLLGTVVLVAQRFGSLDVGARPENFFAGLPRIMLAYCIGIALSRRFVLPPRMALPAWIALPAMPLAILGGWAIDWMHWSFDLAFVLLLCPAMILGMMQVRRESWLGWFSGAISFPLFAVHLPILEASRELGLSVLAAVPIALAAAIIILWWTNRPRRIKQAKETRGV